MEEQIAGLIYEKMPLIMGELGAIAKKQHSNNLDYAYRGIEEIYNEINPLLTIHKVFSVPTVLDMKREERESQKGRLLLYTILTIKYTFYAEDGSFVETVTVGEAMDTSDKSCNKAMSAAHKYALVQAFCIKTGEPNDSEENNHEIGSTDEQLPQKSKPTNPNLEKPACPVCQTNLAVIPGKSEYGGGWVCWKKHKKHPGCGEKFQAGTVPPTAPKAGTEQEPPPSESTLTQKQQLLQTQLDGRFGKNSKNQMPWLEQYGAKNIADLVGDKLDEALDAIKAQLDHPETGNA